MNGKHDVQCNCVACLENMEREVEGNLDVWMPSDRDVQDMFQVVFEKHIQLERVDLNEWGPNERDVQEMCQVVRGLRTTDEITSSSSYSLYPEHAPSTSNHLADLGSDGEVEDVDLPWINQSEQDEDTITDEITSRSSYALYPEDTPITTNDHADLGIEGEVQAVDLHGINQSEQDENAIRVVYSVEDYFQAIKDDPSFSDEFHSISYTSDRFVILEKYRRPQLDRIDFSYLNVDEDVPLVATDVVFVPPHVRNPAAQVLQTTTAERAHNDEVQIINDAEVSCGYVDTHS
jgi:hypothetical protein